MINPPKRPCVYIRASQRNGTLHIGVTADIARRAWLHKAGIGDGLTRRYAVFRLIYVEFHKTMIAAIARERRIKKWRRAWKFALIEKMNPQWIDLFGMLPV
jgi:putative endonuclease